MSENTLGKPSNTRRDDSERSMLVFELPQLPQESNILSHQATQWIEAAEAIISACAACSKWHKVDFPTQP